MPSWTPLGRQRWVQVTIGTLAAEYLRLVAKTNPLMFEPPDAHERIITDAPIILTMWHGQHLMTPFLRPAGERAKVLISRHRDGEINAIAAERLGVGTVRGSGDTGREFHRKGGVAGFRNLLEAIEQGYHVALTADVPKVSRVAGLGVVKLAQMSGRPIYPVAITTSRRFELDNWDRTAINLPFGRAAATITGPIRVAADADNAALEAARRAVQEGLDAATRRVHEMVDQRGRKVARG
jgi:lysophospholipid acyltransferase (LPLAT)-like uncharacterized protein